MTPDHVLLVIGFGSPLGLTLYFSGWSFRLYGVQRAESNIPSAQTAVCGFPEPCQ